MCYHIVFLEDVLHRIQEMAWDGLVQNQQVKHLFHHVLMLAYWCLCIVIEDNEDNNKSITYSTFFVIF